MATRQLGMPLLHLCGVDGFYAILDHGHLQDWMPLLHLYCVDGFYAILNHGYCKLGMPLLHLCGVDGFYAILDQLGHRIYLLFAIRILQCFMPSFTKCSCVQ